MRDRALVIELGDQVDELAHYRVQAAWRLLEAPPLAGVTEVVPAFTTLTLFYDPFALAQAGASAVSLVETLTHEVRSRLRRLPAKVKAKPGPVVEIPVCYGGSFGPDLDQVALQTGLTPEEVVRHHSSPLYLVYLTGFSPGFPYLGGLPEALTVPRRATARTVVPPGSVGIANHQSCIYSMATPGGWNLIGQTPCKLFRFDATPPSLLCPGNRVKFRPITPEEFANYPETP